MSLSYDISQLSLELSTQYSPNENHIVWDIHEFVESLNLNHVYTFRRLKEIGPKNMHNRDWLFF